MNNHTVSNNQAISHQSIIELDSYPFEFLSVIAQHESWRKEIYRPIYHIHKWWANRLGTVFRGIILGCLLPNDADFKKAFYQKQNYSSIKIYDPFMGSGTTLGEAHKLGCISFGQDINPIACESARVSFGQLNRQELISSYNLISNTVGSKIRDLYKTVDNQGQVCDVLYFFWVKYVSCPYCNQDVDLFSSYVFAKNAYTNKKPEVQILCPQCNSIITALISDKKVHCSSCNYVFNPHSGPVHGSKVTCCSCKKTFSILSRVKEIGTIPSHRLYAKLLLDSKGRKFYAPINVNDIQAYVDCSETLQRGIIDNSIKLPKSSLTDGHNTRQAISYNYISWHQFFNDRQLLALSMLQKAIFQLPNISSRDALLTLFSGTLEFNNMFASYKGEGTGAIRHMFAHHILKPERVPIEGNIWGTKKSSGAFSTLFESRLIKAINYRESPYEISLNGKTKKIVVSNAFSGKISTSLTDKDNEDDTIHLSCDSSDSIQIKDCYFDFIVTDPPFFDNVQYSELADFFFSWQSLFPHGFIHKGATTRNQKEVQDTDPKHFSTKLEKVFTECFRVLKNNGLLVFTYHHSRDDGWVSLIDAIIGSGFSVINAHPVKSELSISLPKLQAKEPIQLDIIFVCKKRNTDTRHNLSISETIECAKNRTKEKIVRLESNGLKLSLNDRRITFISQIISLLCPTYSADSIVHTVLASRDIIIAK